jgi:cell wall assembly regulator SMI1
VGKKSAIGRLSYRDKPADGSYSVKTAWKRLWRWSEEYLPRTGRDAQPASAEAIRRFEAAIGQRLPKDVRDSYRVYNGQCAGNGIVFGLAVDPLRSVLNSWKLWVDGYEQNVKDNSAASFDEACSSFPEGYVRPVYFNRGWIPLTYDSGGNHIGVDLNPGPKGTRGQVIVFGRDDEFHTVLALSWGQFLTDLANELEAGNFRLEQDENYPDDSVFTIDDPHHNHFHSVGIYWSRAKLGLRSLSVANKKLWKKWGAK